MSLGTMTIIATAATPDGKLYAVSFPGDSDYHAGGSADLQTALQLAIKTANLAARDANVRGPEAVTIRGVVPNDCGATYTCFYDPAASKLVVRGWDGAQPGDHTDLKATTFKVTILTD